MLVFKFALHSLLVQVCLSQETLTFPDLPRSSQIFPALLDRNAVFSQRCSGRPRWRPLRLRTDAERSHRIQEVQQQRERPGASTDLNGYAKICQNCPTILCQNTPNAFNIQRNMTLSMSSPLSLFAPSAVLSERIGGLTLLQYVSASCVSSRVTHMSVSMSVPVVDVSLPQ